MKLFLSALLIVLAGCTTTPPHSLSKVQSWDQENLKRNDHGCPTAIYVAPDGNLVQCPPQ